MDLCSQPATGDLQTTERPRRAGGNGAGRPGKSRDLECIFIFWFPFEINIEEMRKQLNDGTESV